jgi:Transposase DDE domain
MRIRLQTAEHPFGTIKAWMGAIRFRPRTLEKVSAEMSLHVLAYNLKRMIAVLGVHPLIQAMGGGLSPSVRKSKPPANPSRFRAAPHRLLNIAFSPRPRSNATICWVRAQGQRKLAADRVGFEP